MYKYHSREILTFILIIVFCLTLFAVPWSEGVMHAGGWNTLQAMMSSLLRPEFTEEVILLTIKSLWQTFAYALVSLSLAIAVAIILALFASGILISFTGVRVVFRGIIGVLRGIHELIWAWLFVAAIGLNPLAGIFALAIPYAGYLGKIYTDLLIEVPHAPISALETSGANRMQVFVYGYLPMAFPNMLSYTMYRLECAIRSSSVLSFVGLGGIGFQIQLAMQDLRYERVWPLLIGMIILIWVIDFWGNQLRRRLV